MIPRSFWPRCAMSSPRHVLAAAGPVDAIALANQGESCLAWDARSGRALSPVIVWQDARSRADLAALGPGAAVLPLAVCGLPLDPYFSASKLGWLRREIPAVAEAHAAGRLHLGTTDAFFLDRLCGVFATDVATASRTGLLDLATGGWSEALCAVHGVPLASLPEIRACDAGFGRLNGVPVRASIVDQQAALLGHGCTRPGEAKMTFGTGAFLLACAGKARVHVLEGGVYDAGAALEWARRIGLIDDPATLSDHEGPTALSRGLVFVPALSGLAAPDWDRTAAPVFIGMDHATTREDMARAVLEGVAMLSARLIAGAAASGLAVQSLSIDGGLSANRYFARLLAAATGLRVEIPQMRELTALGLAELAGVDTVPIRAPRAARHRRTRPRADRRVRPRPFRGGAGQGAGMARHFRRKLIPNIAADIPPSPGWPKRYRPVRSSDAPSRPADPALPQDARAEPACAVRADRGLGLAAVEDRIRQGAADGRDGAETRGRA
nr:FGGY-family carbohydrate kinase [Paenirhodobacter enshiensis]